MPQFKSVPIAKMTEPFGTIELEDGAKLNFRTIIVNVQRIFNDDGTPMVLHDGSMAYQIGQQFVSSVIDNPQEKKGMN